MSKLKHTASVLLFLMLFPVNVLGVDAYIDDTFNDLTKIDQAVTTAEVDPANGWVTLGLRNLANSLLLYNDNFDVTLINNDAVETYQYNGTAMELYVPRSITGGLSNPVSISGRWGEYIVLERGTKETTWFHFDGFGMVENGLLGVSALTDPKALDAANGIYDFVLLDGNRLKRYAYDGTGFALIPPLSPVLAGANPISISLEDDDFAAVVLDQANKAVKHYRYSGGSMSLDAAKSIQAPGELSEPRSLSVSKTGGMYLVADSDQVKAYHYDGSAMVYNPSLSVTGLNKPLAVSLKPDLFAYAVLTHDAGNKPQVCYYAFDGTGMVEIPGLRVTGLDDIMYDNDQVLQGKSVETAFDVAGLKLLADVEFPAGTSINWEVTVDGITWQTIVPGDIARFTIPGTKPNYRATLHTDDPAVTPKILSVQLLDASLTVGNFQVTDIIGPVIPGNPALPTDEQVKIWAGYNVTFQIETAGRAESVSADITCGSDVITLSSLCSEITPDEPPGTPINIWTGVFHTNAGVPAGTHLDIFFRAMSGTEHTDAAYPDFAEIYGSALENHHIHLTH